MALLDIRGKVSEALVYEVLAGGRSDPQRGASAKRRTRGFGCGLLGVCGKFDRFVLETVDADAALAAGPPWGAGRNPWR